MGLLVVNWNGKLERYYLSNRFLQNLRLPPRPQRHHYRLQCVPKQGKRYFLRLRHNVRSLEVMRNSILRKKPVGIFFTPTEWLDPIYLRKTRKAQNLDVLLSSPLYFDIDYTSLNPPTIRNAATQTRKIAIAINSLFGRQPDWICFTGRKDFHLYYWDWDNIPSMFPRPSDRMRESIRRRQVLSEDLRKREAKFDVQVTSDPFRIMRLPGSLHSETMQPVMILDIQRFLGDTLLAWRSAFCVALVTVTWSA